MSMLSAGSLILGLVAWILPIINLNRYRDDNHENKRWVVLVIISLSACAISLCFQIFYHHHLVKIEEWSTLMDTAGAVAFVSSVLLIITILLNAATLLVYQKQDAK